MKIDEFEFRDKNGNEIEPTKNQLIIYIKLLHKQIEEKNQELLKFVHRISDQNEEILELKQQLEDKDNEIKPLREQNERVLKKLELIVDDNQDLRKQLNEKEKDISVLISQLCLSQSIDQDKISFAVEQLEKVKTLLFEKSTTITGTSIDCVRVYTINQIINKRIKELIGEL